MKRRMFLTGITGTLTFLAGCIGSSPSGSGDNLTNSPTRSKSTKPPTQRSSTRTKKITKQQTDVTTSQQERKDACNGASFVSFYALESEFADELWSPSIVRVGFNIGAGGHVLLVVLEDNTVLGMTQVEAPDDGGFTSDGDKIPLNTKLSGKHTIRVVMYPATAKSGQFNAKKTTPCQHEGKPIQTEPTTINFSRFSENTSPTP